MSHNTSAVHATATDPGNTGSLSARPLLAELDLLPPTARAYRLGLHTLAAVDEDVANHRYNKRESDRLRRWLLSPEDRPWILARERQEMAA